MMVRMLLRPVLLNFFITFLIVKRSTLVNAKTIAATNNERQKPGTVMWAIPRIAALTITKSTAALDALRSTEAGVEVRL
jgi:hypothetical protein